jgi:hypothetical protein
LLVEQIWRVASDIDNKLVKSVVDKAQEAFGSKIEHLSKTQLEPLQLSIDRFSPYFAFRTDHGRLENLLRQAETIQSKAKWVVPLFVSHKISQDFDSGTEVRIRTTARDYSDIIEELLPFATHSIYMTCPHTPSAWFRALLGDDLTSLTAALANRLTDAQFPGHVRAFLNAQVRDTKKRFVVLPHGSLDEFFDIRNRPALKCFLRFSNSEYGIVTRFACVETLCGGCSTPCDAAGADYQVWDRSAVVEWLDARRPSAEAERSREKICRLMLHPEAEYLRLFDRCFTRPGLTMSSKALLEFTEELDKLGEGQTRSIWGKVVGKNGLMKTPTNDVDAGIKQQTGDMRGNQSVISPVALLPGKQDGTRGINAADKDASSGSVAG